MTVSRDRGLEASRRGNSHDETIQRSRSARHRRKSSQTRRLLKKYVTAAGVRYLRKLHRITGQISKQPISLKSSGRAGSIGTCSDLDRYACHPRMLDIPSGEICQRIGTRSKWARYTVNGVQRPKKINQKFEMRPKRRQGFAVIHTCLDKTRPLPVQAQIVLIMT
jgi:hypothetical protein